MSVFKASVLLFKNYIDNEFHHNIVKVVCGSTWPRFVLLSHCIASRIHSYFDHVMMKFMINYRTDSLKTDVNLLNLQLLFSALQLTDYFSRTKVLWLKCFPQKKRLWIKKLARLDALGNEIKRDHRDSILNSSSSFIGGQSLFSITSDQKACLRDKTE